MSDKARATVHDLPGIHWNAEAAAYDALERVGQSDAFVAIWIDGEGILRLSQSGNDMRTYAAFSVYLADMAMRDVNER